MATWTYESALTRLLSHEGGYSNHPSDPGGPTNFGITIHVYRQFVNPNATAADVKAMKVSEAKSIYRAKYWDAQRCDELPAGVDYAVFDYGVNSGIGRSKKVLQRVVGVTADGVLGPQTMRAVEAKKPSDIINGICDERIAFLKRLKTWPVFGKGWGRRVSECRSISLAMAEKPQAIPEASKNVSTGKAPKDAIPATTNGGASGIAALIAAGAAYKAGLPWWGIALIVVAVAVVAFVAFHKISKRD
jgi:lysozyme family protein